jgi:glucan 1,3-beta-glucosidase
LLGPEKAKTLLQQHYSSWVTEDTFKRIRDLGLNHIRIPIGFWALGNLEPDEPYVPDLSLDYLLQGLKWAAKYGLRLMVELHAAPGPQNGWNHSARSDG